MALVDLTNALAQDHTGQAGPTSVRLTDGTNWLVPVLTSDTQQVGGTVVANQGAAAAGAAAWPVVTVDGSNVLVRPGDAANSALRVNVVAGGAGGGVAQLQLRNVGDTAWVNIGIGQQTMAASVPVVLASDQPAIAISAATLPLPSGAATEATLASILTSSTFTGRINTLGAKSSAASTPVVLATDQAALPITDNAGSLTVDSAQLPASLVSGRLSVDGSAVTQPISAASLPLPTGAATETTLGTRLAESTFTTRVPTVGAKTSAASIPVVLATDEAALPITDNSGSLTIDAPVGTPVAMRLSDGAAFLTTTSGRLATDGSGVTQPISAASLPLPTNAAQEHVTAASPHAVRLTDGAAFYVGPAAAQLPAALVGARLDINAGAWMGSTAATVGQKAMASSLPVALASDQSNVPMNIVQVAGGAVATGGVSGLLGVAGNVAHNVADTGNPIKIGGRAQDPLPTQVTGNNRVDAWYDRRGRAYVSSDYHTGSRLAIGYVHSNRLAVLAAAHAATAGFLWIINQTGSSTFVRVRKALFKAFPVAITAFASAPRITLERFTFTGTASGATLGTALRGESGDAAFVNASIRTANTGMTITQGVALSAGIVPAVLTAVGVGTPTVQDLLQGLVDDFIVLTAGQGLVLRQTDAGTTSDTRIATLDMLVEEYT